MTFKDLILIKLVEFEDGALFGLFIHVCWACFNYLHTLVAGESEQFFEQVQKHFKIFMADGCVMLSYKISTIAKSCILQNAIYIP